MAISQHNDNGHTVSLGFDFCMTFDALAMLTANMTLVAGLLWGDDVIVASDGRLLGREDKPIADRALKTCRLNDDLCVGFSGRATHAEAIFEQLTGQSSRAKWTNAKTVCERWEDSGRDNKADGESDRCEGDDAQSDN